MSPWIVLAWIVTAGFVAGLAAALAWISFHSYRVGKPGDNGQGEAGFSFARYQVMQRLLSSGDVRFLSAQKGFSPRDGARWKRDSVRIFRLYLNELTRDFRALHAHARELVVAAHAESPELASTLVRQQAAFWRARLALEGRLLLFQWGIGSVDVAPLLAMLEAMRTDLFRLVPQSVPAV